jgi:hypothetical protein
MFDKFPIQNGLKQGSNLLPVLCNCGLEYAIRKAQTHQLLFYYAIDVSLLGENICPLKIKENYKCSVT